MSDHIQQALDLTRAQATVRPMTDAEIINMLGSLAQGIKSLSEGSPTPTTDGPAINPGTAIKEKSITCVICGKSFKLLTKKHLAAHGYSPQSYRDLCGYKKGAPLASKLLSRERRKKMQSMKLWERRGNGHAAATN
jgi:predicted transcriptional regulator